MKKSMLYTRTGDQGTTALVGGARVPKTHLRLEAYGTMDELNTQLGLLVTYLTDEADVRFLQRIQNHLFVIGSHLATDRTKTALREASILHPELVAALEQEIDRLDASLPAQRAFILPGGSRPAAVCHVCRTVCRRAERRILSLAEQVEVDAEILSYMNRLSDYLFILSRKLNMDEKKDEIFWDNSCM
ncbi:MAG: cob(I)yrinic acid a,c-diamide adenosyltransferase [Bacteroides sp.]|nr:cob(I)yrinic acid a,c-diamide adenosyltransferase [Bacteroides sp.]